MGGQGPTAGGYTEGRTHFTLSSCSPNSSSLKPKWSMKAEVMRCIWKSTKACRGQKGGGQGRRAGQAGRGRTVQPTAHLLQHSLLGEAELLEPVVLVVTGGVQVVGVHLGGQEAGVSGRGCGYREAGIAGVSRASPGPPCSSCWSQPGAPTRRPPTAPAAQPAVLLRRETRTAVGHGPWPPAPPPQGSPHLTLQQLPQLLCIGPLLCVLHQGVGHSRQVAHVAFPRAPCRPG